MTKYTSKNWSMTKYTATKIFCDIIYRFFYLNKYIGIYTLTENLRNVLKKSHLFSTVTLLANDVHDLREIYAICLKLEYVVVYLKILGLDFFQIFLPCRLVVQG